MSKALSQPKIDALIATLGKQFVDNLLAQGKAVAAMGDGHDAVVKSALKDNDTAEDTTQTEDVVADTDEQENDQQDTESAADEATTEGEESTDDILADVELDGKELTAVLLKQSQDIAALTGLVTDLTTEIKQLKEETPAAKAALTKQAVLETLLGTAESPIGQESSRVTNKDAVGKSKPEQNKSEIIPEKATKGRGGFNIQPFAEAVPQ